MGFNIFIINLLFKPYKMAKQILSEEFRRMQKLAGIITETQYTKLVENEEAEAINAAEKAKDTIVNNDKLEQKVDSLTPDQIADLEKTLANLGVTADSSIKDVANKIAPKIEKIVNESEESTQEKVADALSSLGGGLMVSHFVPLIPIAIGNMIDSVAGGFAVTILTAGALIGLAQLLKEKNKKPNP